MTETLAYGYSSESAQRELCNEYQHDRVKMVFKNLCILVLWTKVDSALEGLSYLNKSSEAPVGWLKLNQKWRTCSLSDTLSLIINAMPSHAVFSLSAIEFR